MISDNSRPAAVENVGRQKKARFRDSVVWEYTQIFAVAFIIVFGFIRPFLIEPYKIPSGSMEDTLLVGDRVLVIKFLYGVKLPGTMRRLFPFARPQRGDVFVFSPKHRPDTHFIKRVVAVAGDTVETRGQTLIVNGKPLTRETYTKHTQRYRLPDFPPFQGPLVPYFFEQPDAAASVRDYASRQEVRVQVRDGKPAAMDVAGEPTYVVRVLGSQREREPGLGIGTYYYVDADNDRQIRRGVLYRNAHNQKWYLTETLAPHRFAEAFPEGHPFTIPKGHFFAMGDNRENSEDSRAWGPVPFDVVKGKAILVYWSTDLRSSAPPWAFYKRIRFGRVGRRIRSQYGW